MAARQIIVPGAMPSRDANGRALPAKLRFYLPGTTTPTTVYADEALTAEHPFPLISDAGGRWPPIWAEEDLYFNVAWSDLAEDVAIATYDNVRPLSDAILASATLAQTAADFAGIARDEAEAIAAKFGDVDAAITAAQTAQEGAETAAGAANTILNGPGGVVALRDETQALRDETQEFRDQAEAIVGFDPANVVRTDIVQAFSDAAKLQARANIGAQPVVGIFDQDKTQSVNVASGVVTVDLANGPVVIVNWTANIASLVVSNVPTGTDTTSMTLILKANGGTTFSPGAAFKGVNNVTPTWSTTVGDENYVVFTTRSAGAGWAYFAQGFIRP